MTRGKFAVLTVGDLRNFRYRRAPTAHPFSVGSYSDIIRGYCKLLRFAVSFFAAVSRFKLAVLNVGDICATFVTGRRLQRTILTFIQIYFLYETLNGLRGKGSQTVFVI